MINITDMEINFIERLILEMVHIKFNLNFISDPELYQSNIEEYDYYNQIFQSTKLSLKNKYLSNMSIKSWYIDFKNKQIKYEEG